MTDTSTPDRLIIEVDRDGWTGSLQVQIARLDADDTGDGYRLAGPKYNGSGERLLRAELDQRDANEIRSYLDAMFPPQEAAAPALDRWQAATGWPQDDYFAAVAGYLTDPTTPVLSWHHDEPWEAAIEMAEDGVPTGWDEAHIAWRVDEDCEPTHCDDFTGYGWYLILTRTNHHGQDSHTTQSLNLAYMAEPRDVAQAARTLLGGGDRA